MSMVTGSRSSGRFVMKCFLLQGSCCNWLDIYFEKIYLFKNQSYTEMGKDREKEN